jgi:hypothetical protein
MSRDRARHDQSLAMKAALVLAARYDQHRVHHVQGGRPILTAPEIQGYVERSPASGL